jgi:hypothetical protein
VNTPLPQVIAQTVGLATQRATLPYACNPDGWGIPSSYRVLHSPSDYNLGAHGYFLSGVTQVAEQDLIRPIWYVYPDSGGGSQVGTCGAGHLTVETVQIAINPDAHTELHAVGLRNQALQP